MARPSARPCARHAGLFLERRHHVGPREPERGTQTEHDRAKTGSGERGGEHAQVRRRVEDDGKHRQEREQRRGDEHAGAVGDPQSEGPARQRQQRRLDQQLAHDAPPAGADGQPDGDLPLPQAAAGEKHVGQVEGHHQEQRGCHGEDEGHDHGEWVRVSGRARVPDPRHGPSLDRLVPVLGRVVAFHGSAEHLEAGRGRFDRQAVGKPRDDAVGVVGAIEEAAGRAPDVGAPARLPERQPERRRRHRHRSREARRRDADHRARPAADDEGAPDHRRFGAAFVQ